LYRGKSEELRSLSERVFKVSDDKTPKNRLVKARRLMQVGRTGETKKEEYRSNRKLQNFGGGSLLKNVQLEDQE
jgi:hypothetical protein